MPTYSFEARNNYRDIETFAPYESKREAHAAQVRLAERGYADFSAVTEEPEGDEGQDREGYTDTQDRESYVPDTRPMFACLPEIPVTDEQEPEDEEDSVDLIASGYDWICPFCETMNHVIEYDEKVTCRDCGHTYEANPPIHPTG
jgi:hypothetical protein